MIIVGCRYFLKSSALDNDEQKKPRHSALANNQETTHIHIHIDIDIDSQRTRARGYCGGYEKEEHQYYVSTFLEWLVVTRRARATYYTMITTTII